MDRRVFLGVLAGTALTAGCMDRLGMQAPTPTPAETPTPTHDPTPTPTPETTPEVTRVELVDEWERSGDVEDNRISEMPAGEPLIIGFTFRYYLHDGTIQTFEQVRIYDDAGERVRIDHFEGDQIYEQDGYATFEHAIAFDSRGLEPGEYTAEAQIRDDVTGEVSNIEDVTFDIRPSS